MDPSSKKKHNRHKRKHQQKSIESQNGTIEKKEQVSENAARDMLYPMTNIGSHHRHQRTRRRDADDTDNSSSISSISAVSNGPYHNDKDYSGHDNSCALSKGDDAKELATSPINVPSAQKLTVPKANEKDKYTQQLRLLRSDAVFSQLPNKRSVQTSTRPSEVFKQLLRAIPFILRFSFELLMIYGCLAASKARAISSRFFIGRILIKLIDVGLSAIQWGLNAVPLLYQTNNFQTHQA